MTPLAPAAYDLAPLAALLAIGALLAAVPFLWVWRRAPAGGRRLQALTVLALALTFDLVLFGAYTRLSDSGLGCPDWPGCYASASPLGAHGPIAAAQADAPAGPVTVRKAWIEMTHRYLATAVGALIAGLAAASWWLRRRGRNPVSPWWPTATLAWVVVQGAFGAWTVTWKLYPLVVTAHLLGALGLVALLAGQREAGHHDRLALELTPGLQRGAILLGLASLVQIALGGWVSTNDAVLACRDFPACQGSFWPAMDFASAYEPLRELGRRVDGTALPFEALTAIHYAHRLGAYGVLGGMALFAWALGGAGRPQRRWAHAVWAVAAWQFVSGVSNVVFDWPLASALAHTGGATAWVLLMTTLLVRSRRAPARVAAVAPATLDWKGAS